MIAPWWYWRIAAGLAALIFPLAAFALYVLLLWGWQYTRVEVVASWSLLGAGVVGVAGVLLLPLGRRRWSCWCFAASTGTNVWAWTVFDLPSMAGAVGLVGTCASLGAWHVRRDLPSKP